MDNIRKQIAFDLDTKMLKVYYPKKSWTNAYEDIRNHMINNGFEWQQYSVYVSKEPMLHTQVDIIIGEMYDKHIWLNKCVRDIEETDLPSTHSLNYWNNPNIYVPTREEVLEQNQKKVRKRDIEEEL